MKNVTDDIPHDDIESRAAAWMVRRDGGGMSEREHAEFEQWCAEDPRHAAAVEEYQAVWAAFDRPVAAGQGDILRLELNALKRKDRRRWMVAGATTLAAAASLLLLFGLSRSLEVESTKKREVASTEARVVEPARRVLADGSVVELKQGAEIKVRYSENERIVTLVKGEAHFSVTKNPDRPFIVKTGTVDVSAVGTAFSVGLGQKVVDVLVTEGRVRVAPAVTDDPEHANAVHGPQLQRGDFAPDSPLVAAGQRAVVALGTVHPAPKIVPISDSEFKERLAWRLPRLEFSATSLREAVALFNGYNQVQMHLADNAVAEKRITGVFRSDNVHGFIRVMESAFNLRVEERGSDVFLHSAGQDAP